MMKLVKFASNLRRMFFKQWLRSYFGTMALTVGIAAQAQSFESSYFAIPTDTLSRVILDWQYPATTQKQTYLKMPSKLQLALGWHRSNHIFHIHAESQKSLERSALRLYSLGGGCRTLFRSHMIGSYAFLDATFQEKTTQQYAIDLCNLNLGFEYGGLKGLQLTVNSYIPLKAYGYDLKDYTLTTNSVPSNVSHHTVVQSYYLESGNYGGDISLKRSWAFNKYLVTASMGGYMFHDKPKTLFDIQYPQNEARWIFGITPTLHFQYNQNIKFSYKAFFDNSKRYPHAVIGVHFQTSTHSPGNTGHQHLWAPIIERHLSPLLIPERVPHTVNAVHHLNTIWLSQNESYYEPHDFKLVRAMTQLLETKYHVTLYNLLEETRAKYHEELKKPLKQQDVPLNRKLWLFTHPDKEPLFETLLALDDFDSKDPAMKNRLAAFLKIWPTLINNYAAYHAKYGAYDIDARASSSRL